MSISWKLGLAGLMAATVLGSQASSAEAAEITCLPSESRVAKLDSAVSCSTSDGNINKSDDLNDVFSTDHSWVKEGELTGNGTNDLFKVTLLTGSWGASTGITGAWEIDPSFWNT